MSRARKQINEVAWPGVLIAECLAVMEGEGTAAKTLKSGVGLRSNRAKTHQGGGQMLERRDERLTSSTIQEQRKDFR